ncbi:hypothetical protein [Mesorhizobium sp. B2-3-14]|uniref:hypothetical protein n=1 Tax=Mesorhizobium sp. B2-3-14 TaxID=2589950 RepID=UPI0015E3D817|nr:hypothetical protein [Mesorhizobium sp. B2-3-14]
MDPRVKPEDDERAEWLGAKAPNGHHPKQNGPPFSRPLVFDIEPLTGPALVPGRALVREPALALALALVQEPGRVQELVRLAWPVRRASSVQPVRAPEPVCWPLAARRVPGARHHFFRKHNTRQSPG